MKSDENVSSFDVREFRKVLGNFATGVTIVTAEDGTGEKAGMTANSFSSVSLDPPLVQWCIDKSARSLHIFDSAKHFAINILAADQIDLSNRFSRQQDDKFAGIPWTRGVFGSPILSQTAACLQCESYDRIDAGDHWILIGKVVAFGAFGRPPLCYYQGSYSVVVSHPIPRRDEGNRDSNGVPRLSLEDNAYYLLVRAVRAFQSSYQPVRDTLNFSRVESSILIVLRDRDTLDANGFLGRITAPESDIKDSLASLMRSGMLQDVGGIYSLSELGKVKSDALWTLSEAHLAQALAGFDAQQIENFKAVLRGIIARCSPARDEACA